MRGLSSLAALFKNNSKNTLLSCLRARRALTGYVPDVKLPFVVESDLPTTKITTLENGVRVATYAYGSPSCSVGLFIGAGSRYETAQTNGTAHFLEHMAFKGTEKLSQDAMEREVEQIGCKLLAYTSREHTAYYGKCFAQDGPRVVEILSDIIQYPLLSENAIEREKGVILREMEEVESQVEEVLFDYLHGTAYQGSSLGYTILGPSENIKAMTRENLSHYIRNNYTGPRTVLVAVGDVEHNEYVDLAKKYLSNLDPNFFHPESPIREIQRANYIGSETTIRIDDMPHAHIAIAFEGCSHTHPDFIPLMLASLHVGNYNQSMAIGKSHYSRLARRAANDGLCNSFTSFNACYNDTGLWGIYFVTERLKIIQTLFAIGREWSKLRNSLTDFDTLVAKNLFMSSYLMQLDGTTPIFEEIGRQILAYNQYLSPYDIACQVQNVTTEQVREAVCHVMNKADHAVASMGPVEGLPSYMTVKGFLYNPFS